MLRKDKRSLVLSLVLGDGNLHILKNGRSCMLSIDHGLSQADYQAWKASLLSKIFERDVRCRSGHRGKSVQVQVAVKRMKAWKKFCYPNNKKDIARILPFINNPTLAIAIWLMDDGYVEGQDTKYPSARFRLFTCDQTLETQDKIIEWFKVNFGVVTRIKYMHDKRTNKTYPYLKWGQEDSLKMWKIIREFVLQFKSMKYKFRFIEDIYQKRTQMPTNINEDVKI